MADLLGTETDGLAIDFTDTTQFDLQVYSQQWNQKRVSSVDTYSSPHTFYTNGSTTPKVVKTSSTVLGWSPHNYVLQSQTFDNAAWTKTRTTVTANQTAAPDGTTTADKWIEDTSVTSTHQLGPASNITNQLANYPYTMSMYIKNFSGTRLVDLEVFETAAFTDGLIAKFDPVNGTVFSASASGTGSVISSGCDSLGNGWFRAWVTGIYSTTNARTTISFFHKITLADGTTSYTGDGASGVYIWGAQWNRGPLTAYTVTTAAAAVACPVSYGEGLLVEPAATNLITFSQQFNSWTQTNMTASANSTTGPDNLTTADTETESTATNFHLIAAASITSVANSTYTFSVYAKIASGTRNIVVNVSSTGGTHQYEVVCNLTSGTIVANNTVGSATLVGSTLTALANSWYRITVSGSFNDTASFCKIGNVTGSTFNSYTGDGTSGHYLWGAQFELGSLASSYFPTISASTTRATDAVHVATSAYPHSATNGTFVAWIAKNVADSSTADRVLNVNDGTANEVLSLDVVTGDTPDSFGVDVIDGGAAQVASSTTKTGSVTTAGNKAAFCYKANDTAIVVDGGGEVSDSSCTMPTVTDLQLGYSQDTASRELNGFIQKLWYFPRRLTSSEMAQMTSVGYLTASGAPPMRGLCLSNFGYRSIMVGN